MVGQRFLVLKFTSNEREYHTQVFLYPVLEASYLSNLNLKYVSADLISEKATNQKFTSPISAFVWNWHPADKNIVSFLIHFSL